MSIDQSLLDCLIASAQFTPWLRMNLDLHNSPDDGSQRMLNALVLGTVALIHQQGQSSETMVCFRGHLQMLFYNGTLDVTDGFDFVPGGSCAGMIIPNGQWHLVVALESGTVIKEVKDWKYEALGRRKN